MVFNSKANKEYVFCRFIPVSAAFSVRISRYVCHPSDENPAKSAETALTTRNGSEQCGTNAAIYVPRASQLRVQKA
jgi:hypothetical protein